MVQKEDNRLKAIIAQTVTQIGVVCMASTFKLISSEGFHVIDFLFFRNCLAITVSWILCACNGMNPLKSFPWDHKYKLLFRCITGQLNFGLINVAISMAPISLAMLCWTTSPFWVSIIGYFLNGEPVLLLEILSMLVCFACVIVIMMQPSGEES